MLKTTRGRQVWLVTQPDHGRIAGYLAAHWGNDQFTAPGHFPGAVEPERLNSETVLAIAEHDNGWWEWEAVPELGASDGLPLDLPDVLKNQQAGMNRWRKGIPRLSREHPYVGLLISWHAYYLHAAKAKPDIAPENVHPLFWKRAPADLYLGPLEEDLKFLTHLEGHHREFSERLRADPATASWVGPDVLKPHVRLLQSLDGLSLALTSPHIPAAQGEAKGLGEDAFDLLEVARRDWQDRVDIRVRPGGDGKLTLDPYPFDVDPLRVAVPVRIVDAGDAPSDSFYSWWHAQPVENVQFELSAV